VIPRFLPPKKEAPHKRWNEAMRKACTFGVGASFWFHIFALASSFHIEAYHTNAAGQPLFSLFFTGSPHSSKPLPESLRISFIPRL
jgi:hypothetical protein